MTREGWDKVHLKINEIKMLSLKYFPPRDLKEKMWKHLFLCLILCLSVSLCVVSLFLTVTASSCCLSHWDRNVDAQGHLKLVFILFYFIFFSVTFYFFFFDFTFTFLFFFFPHPEPSSLLPPQVGFVAQRSKVHSSDTRWWVWERKNKEYYELNRAVCVHETLSSSQLST